MGGGGGEMSELCLVECGSDGTCASTHLFLLPSLESHFTLHIRDVQSHVTIQETIHGQNRVMNREGGENSKQGMNILSRGVHTSVFAIL